MTPTAPARRRRNANEEDGCQDKEGTKEREDMSEFLRIEIVRILQAHRGRENALPREKLRERLSLFNPDLNDRELRKLYSCLPICSCAEGLFLPVTAGEVQEFKEYLTNGPGGPIVAHRRVATILAFYPKLALPAFQQELPWQSA